MAVAWLYLSLTLFSANAIGTNTTCSSPPRIAVGTGTTKTISKANAASATNTRVPLALQAAGPLEVHVFRYLSGWISSAAMPQSSRTLQREAYETMMS